MIMAHFILISKISVMTDASLFYATEWVSERNCLRRRKFERGDLEFLVQKQFSGVRVLQVEGNSILSLLQKVQ